jgi:hypothetical protein
VGDDNGREIQAIPILEDDMTHSLVWDRVTHAEVLRALQQYDELGRERFFSVQRVRSYYNLRVGLERTALSAEGNLGHGLRARDGPAPRLRRVRGRKGRRRHSARKAWIHRRSATLSALMSRHHEGLRLAALEAPRCTPGDRSAGGAARRASVELRTAEGERQPEDGPRFIVRRCGWPGAGTLRARRAQRTA